MGFYMYRLFTQIEFYSINRYHGFLQVFKFSTSKVSEFNRDFKQKYGFPNRF